MSEGCLLWHSRHCGRDTTGVLYKGPLTPSEKRAARLIRQALCINLGRIFAALSVRSWEILRYLGPCLARSALSAASTVEYQLMN